MEGLSCLYLSQDPRGESRIRADVWRPGSAVWRKVLLCQHSSRCTKKYKHKHKLKEERAWLYGGKLCCSAYALAAMLCTVCDIMHCNALVSELKCTAALEM